MTEPPLLQARDLNIWFDLPDGRELHAVRGVDLHVRPGEKLGVVGESGCGKSTLLMSLMGLLPPTATVAGSVFIGGQEVLAGGEPAFRAHRWKNVAMVFQGAMNSLNPVMRIGRQVTEVLELHGIATGASALNRARELMQMVGLPADVVTRYNHELSGGMRQRVSLAMALACNPRVLLADEPTTALDVMVAAQVLDVLDRLTRELGLALVLVTHDLPLVSRSCDRVQVMYAGNVVETGAPADLYHQPQHPYTRLLFAATADVHSERADLISITGAPPRLDEPVSGCAFLPRCPLAQSECMTEVPRLLPVSPAQAAACRYAGSEVQLP